MIKETVDAIRLAELNGEKIINTATMNSQGMKRDVVAKGEEYRNNAMNLAKKNAEKEMADLIEKCNLYENQKKKEIEIEVLALEKNAYEKMESTIDAIINECIV